MTFKIGQRVRRTTVPFTTCKVGDVNTVRAVRGEASIELEGHAGSFSADRFELAEASVPAPVPELDRAGLPVDPDADTYIAKRDQGKPQFDLLTEGCPLAQLGLVQVLTWAVETKGYKPHSWQTVPEAIKRYTAALHRHLNAKARGERYDAESGMLHDWHVLACATFLAELEARADKKAT